MTTDTLTKTGAALNRGRSRQDYSTPIEFIHAVEKRFGKIDCDLAASVENTKAPRFITEQQDSLSMRWPVCNTLLWLNPPFSNIVPWAKKCYEESLLGAHILMLVPASVGSNWFAEFVHEKARVYFLRPRLVFEWEKDPYPRDLLLANCGPVPGYECWHWKHQLLSTISS